MVVAAKQTEGGFGDVFGPSAMREKSESPPPPHSVRHLPHKRGGGVKSRFFMWEMNLVPFFSPKGEGGAWRSSEYLKTSFAEGGRRRAMKIDPLIGYLGLLSWSRVR